MKKQERLKLIVLFAITIIAYIPTFIWMVNNWSGKNTYYSHGFLIPLISAYLIWQKRKKLAELNVKPSSLGWLFLLSGVFIYVISRLWRVGFSAGFSFILVLIGLVMLSLSREFLKQLLFPIGFLIFMVPLPDVAVAGLSFKLKIFAAQASTFIVKGLGVPAIRDGSVIRTMHSYLMVEDPCSGIRSLIALIALGALAAYLSNLSRTKKVILFLSSIPIAIGANIIRIVALTLASEIYGQKAALGLFHDVMGFLVFVFAFLGLMLIGKLLE